MKDGIYLHSHDSCILVWLLNIFWDPLSPRENVIFFCLNKGRKKMMDEIGCHKFYLNMLSLICILFLGPTGVGKSYFFSSPSSSMLTEEPPKELIKQVWQLKINNCSWLIVSKLQMQSHSQKSSWPVHGTAVSYRNAVINFVLLSIMCSCEFSAITCRKRLLLFFEEGPVSSHFSVLYFCAVLFLSTRGSQKGVSERHYLQKHMKGVSLILTQFCAIYICFLSH